jgi:hypothetical protein
VCVECVCVCVLCECVCVFLLPPAIRVRIWQEEGSLTQLTLSRNTMTYMARRGVSNSAAIDATALTTPAAGRVISFRKYAKRAVLNIIIKGFKRVTIIPIGIIHKSGEFGVRCRVCF